MAVQVQIRFDWRPIGQVHVDQRGRLAFPKTADVPSLYRFDLTGPQQGTAYIGETDRLCRRFQHYRTPGPSQETNKRLNALMIDVLKSHGTVSVALLDGSAKVTINEREQAVNFARKQERVLLEHAAICAAFQAGENVLNL